MNDLRTAGMSIDDVAADWLAARDRGVAVEKDPKFAAWINATPAHAAAWQRALAMWDEFDGAPDPLLEAMQRDALSARRSTQWARGWMATAACILVLVIVGVAGWPLLTPSSPAGLPIALDAAPSFETSTGAPTMFTLSDGSIVTLDTNSAIAVAQTSEQRAVRLLRGRAYFRVVHEASRPFETYVGTRTITDLGTEFSVRLDADRVSVVLAEGGVSIAANDSKPMTLRPGERLIAVPGQPDVVTQVDLDHELAWRSGYLEFRDETLESAIAEINRYGGKAAHVGDASLNSLKVTGRFQTGDPVRFARALAEMYSLKVVARADGGVDLVRR